MRIAILAHSLHTAGGYSVGLNFVKSLGEVDTSNQFFIVAPSGLKYEGIELPRGGELYLYRGSRSLWGRALFDGLKLPRMLKDFRADVVLGMGNAGLRDIGCRQAILVQDSHMLYDEKHYEREVLKGKLKWRYQKYRMRQALTREPLIFCQTPVTKERFAWVFNYPESMIRVMPNAVSEYVDVRNDQIKVPDVFANTKKYTLFYLAKYYAHKNFEILADTFASFRDELNDVRCIITISPDQHPNAPGFLKSIADRGLSEKIVNVGPLKQEELAGYFHHADALIFPTLLESFSGTYLEAMHFGLPILTSDLDFARYICGDAALYFNPWDPADVARQVLRLKSDPALRRTLVEQGTRRMSVFFRGWKEITAEVIGEMERLVMTTRKQGALE